MVLSFQNSEKNIFSFSWYFVNSFHPPNQVEIHFHIIFSSNLLMYWWSRRNHPFQFDATFKCRLIPIRNVIYYLEYIYICWFTDGFLFIHWKYLSELSVIMHPPMKLMNTNLFATYRKFIQLTYVMQWLNNFHTNSRNVNKTFQIQKLRWNRKWNHIWGIVHTKELFRSSHRSCRMDKSREI